ncbi:energy transducer TonB [Methylosinus sp. Sm6]|uniref:energy transducer TonB n=1 Tax=Methylosinus sp. Sm6 TaxID=2866948 RepID=UPI001C9A255F|nr:energy transducer TonB [Methylosinus sp. Sm6]MBY6242564.1 energy transducer TonB [Methylosinus sp. Sm6]
MKQLFMIAALVIGGPAIAAEGDAPAPPADAAPAMADHGAMEKPAQKKPKSHAAMGEEKGKDKAKGTEAKTEKKTSEQKPALSKTAYAKLLAAEIKRHTPPSSDAQTGSIHVAFTVGSSGRIVSHKVQSASNPALEPVVGHILASVRTPPPPGGSFSAVQEFNFH